MKKLVELAIIIVILGGIGFAVMKLTQDGFVIKVNNETDQEVSGLYLTYENIISDYIIPPIPSDGTYKVHVEPKENSTNLFDEAALKLEYKDSNGKLHTEYVIGYFEKGYSGRAVVNINSVDGNGKLEVEIK